MTFCTDLLTSACNTRTKAERTLPEMPSEPAAPAQQRPAALPTEGGEKLSPPRRFRETCFFLFGAISGCQFRSASIQLECFARKAAIQRATLALPFFRVEPTSALMQGQRPAVHLFFSASSDSNQTSFRSHGGSQATVSLGQRSQRASGECTLPEGLRWNPLQARRV